MNFFQLFRFQLTNPEKLKNWRTIENIASQKLHAIGELICLERPCCLYQKQYSSKKRHK